MQEYVPSTGLRFSATHHSFLFTVHICVHGPNVSSPAMCLYTVYLSIISRLALQVLWLLYLCLSVKHADLSLISTLALLLPYSCDSEQQEQARCGPHSTLLYISRCIHCLPCVGCIGSYTDRYARRLSSNVGHNPYTPLPLGAGLGA